jgi:endo-1,4-beta-D-glucanase Y
MAKASAGKLIAVLLLTVGLATSSAAGAQANRPFPFHTTLPAGVISPSNVSQAEIDAAIRRHYTAWKNNYLRDLGGGNFWIKYDRTNSTVSEAHGYGMVLAAYMADKTIFDSMFRYFRAHPSINAPHLMAWKQTLKDGVMVSIQGKDSATDGDMDIAYSLLLADVQWGSAGRINYRGEALKVLHDILAHEVNKTTWTLTPGDWATSVSDRNHTRPSDFMTSHLLAFAKADVANASKWNNVYRAVTEIVNFQFQNGSQTTGLMPDFMVKSGSNFVPVPSQYLEGPHDGDFDYNACRTPWRLSMSRVVLGRTEMIAALRKQTAWIRTTTGGIPTKIRAGYFVRNGPNGKSYVNFDDLAFTAPFAVNAMLGGAAAQNWLNRLWTSMSGGDYSINEGYFGDAIRLQVMLMVAGDWWLP